MYEIYSKMRDLYGVKDGTVAAATGIPRSTFTEWRTGRSKPKEAKLSKLAEYFDVTTDFLIGKTDEVICPICHQRYEPLNSVQFAEHKIHHDKYITAQAEYGELMTYAEASQKRTEAIEVFRNKDKSDEERIRAFEAYLDAEFSLRVYRSNFASGLNREEIARTEIETLQPDYALSVSLINRIRREHGMLELPSESTYYYDTDVKEIADFLMKSPEYRVLFDAARKVKPEDIDLIKNLIDKMR